MVVPSITSHLHPDVFSSAYAATHQAHQSQNSHSLPPLPVLVSSPATMQPLIKQHEIQMSRTSFPGRYSYYGWRRFFLISSSRGRIMSSGLQMDEHVSRGVRAREVVPCKSQEDSEGEPPALLRMKRQAWRNLRTNPKRGKRLGISIPVPNPSSSSHSNPLVLVLVWI